MTVNELITQINIDTNEILDDNTEYLPYINASIDILASLLIPMHDTEVVKHKTIHNDDVVPSDFMSFVPGSGYPVEVYDGWSGCGRCVLCHQKTAYKPDG